LAVYRIPGYKVKDWVHLIPLPNTYRDSRHREEHMLEDLWDYHARWVMLSSRPREHSLVYLFQKHMDGNIQCRPDTKFLYIIVLMHINKI
jgi:hypothetical protein